MPSRRDPAPVVSGVILAAGPSSRFDGPVPKQLARFDGEPLVRRVARTALASQLRQVLVVVGHEAATVGSILTGLAVELVENPAYLEGQSTSVRAGLARVERAAEAAIFLPVDQPLLTAALIDRLIASFAATAALVVLPTIGGQYRAPALISRRLFPRLSEIEGDEGARQLFSRLSSDEIAEVEIEDSRQLADVDTRLDLHRLRRSG